MSNDESLFKWSPKYSVNIKAIDDQHRELVNIVNRLCKTITKREDDKAIAEILDALMGYAQTHFALEESLMERAQFEDYEAHKLEHKEMMEQLHQMCFRHSIEELPIYYEMLSFLKAWLKDHLLGEIRKYGTALRQSEFSVAAWEQEVALELAFMSNAKRPWWQFWKLA